MTRTNCDTWLILSPEVWWMYAINQWITGRGIAKWRQNKTHFSVQNTLKLNLFANEKSERWNGPSSAEYVCQLTLTLTLSDENTSGCLIPEDKLSFKLFIMTTILQLACKALQWKMFYRVWISIMSHTHNGLGK